MNSNESKTKNKTWGNDLEKAFHRKGNMNGQ